MSEKTNTEHQSIRMLFYLMAAGARGTPVRDIYIDWNEVFPLAIEQHVQTLLACALLHSPGLECPDEMRAYLLNNMRSASSVNLIRRQRIMHLLAEMKDAGIDATVLKGDAVARYYVHPECRDSVDADILVSLEQEATMYDFLQKRGFNISRRSLTSHHAECRHSKYGLIEVHVHLYDEIVTNVWFEKIQENECLCEMFEWVETEDGAYGVLGPTDQLVFLTLHMVKHFIEGGVSLRMLCDVALCFQKNKERINSERFWSIMTKLKVDEFVNCVLWMMVQEAGFHKSDFIGMCDQVPEGINGVYEDIECGGYMGVLETEERYACCMEFNRRKILEGKCAIYYYAYMVCWKLRSCIKRIFPGPQEMRRIYPFLDSKTVLLPFAWLSYAAVFVYKKLQSGILNIEIRRKNDQMSDVEKRRLDLFRQLHFL